MYKKIAMVEPPFFSHSSGKNGAENVKEESGEILLYSRCMLSYIFFSLGSNNVNERTTSLISSSLPSFYFASQLLFIFIFSFSHFFLWMIFFVCVHVLIYLQTPKFERFPPILFPHLFHIDDGEKCCLCGLSMYISINVYRSIEIDNWTATSQSCWILNKYRTSCMTEPICNMHIALLFFARKY